jgi:hypothetical protein
MLGWGIGRPEALGARARYGNARFAVKLGMCSRYDLWNRSTTALEKSGRPSGVSPPAVGPSLGYCRGLLLLIEHGLGGLKASGPKALLSLVLVMVHLSRYHSLDCPVRALHR